MTILGFDYACSSLQALQGGISTLALSPDKGSLQLALAWHRKLQRLGPCWQANIESLDQLLKPVCFVPFADELRVEISQRSLDCRALVRFGWTEQQSPTKAAAADASGTAAYSDCYAVLTHLVRDWSDDGAAARRAVYEPIMKLLSRHVPTVAAAAAAAVDTVQAAPPLLLVPGAGLGRLCVELAASGWRVQANECSGVMLAAANSIINSRSSSSSSSSSSSITGSSTRNSAASIFPYLHDTNSDQLQSESRFRCVQYAQDVDDLLTAAAPRLAFHCGDFLQLYSGPAAAAGAFDAAVTCFFIDTAADIRQYLSTLANAVRVGGFWINLGPLHFHRNAQLVLSFDELQLLMAAAGWTMLHCEQLPPCDYRAAAAGTADVAVGGSTYVEQYRPLLWVCQRNSVDASIVDSIDDRDSDRALRQQLLYEGLFT
jgi:N2227-like protein